jgi:transcription initiation factor IIE alpha subunit
VPKIVVRLTSDEITVLCNCINETLESLDDAELADRVGVDRQQARALLGRLSEKRADARRLAAT